MKVNKNNFKKEGMQYTYEFKVPRSTELLEFLLSKMNMSRNSVKRLLSEHKVVVNGVMISQFNYPLSKDDEVKIAKNGIKTVQGKQAKKANPIKDLIIYEDEDFIAINKPNGLLSVQSDKERLCAYSYVEDYMKSRDPKSRPYILHRIDKETSGVLVFAKDIKIHSMLRMHWNDDIKLREYYAVCNGHFDQKEGTIVNYLKENSNNMMYISQDKNGKKAITNYEVVAENADYSLLRVHIDTGRKNQIRIQTAFTGHSIIGDDKYGSKESPIGRLGLHASELDFIHPVTKELLCLKAPVPAEFKKLFKK